MSRGRGYGDPVPAESLRGPTPLSMFSQENRQRIQEQILAQDADLDRRLRSEDEYELDNADEELHHRRFAQCKKEFEALPLSEKQYYEQQALETKYENWRIYRASGELIENDESLAQKARDDAMGITGPIGGRGRGRGRGRGGGAANVLHQQGTGGALVGGPLMRTPLEELTPPYDRVKAGKIASEEYF